MIPEPILKEHDGIIVVRDDMLPGGTKRRAVHALFDEQHSEYVYAGPVYGHAQLALANAAQDYDKQATIFCAKRKVWHPMTQATADAGADIVEIPNGYLTVVKARAREYCERVGAKMLPFGLDHPHFIIELARIARALPVQPTEVWTIVGSGVLTRALQLAWPDARFYGVQVGATPNAGRATVIQAQESYEANARILPPFPSNPQYDAKAWRYIKQSATPGALFWNVGA